MENSEYKEMFLSDAREHVDKLNNLLVEIEKNPNNDDIINNIFRIFHTLKGNSATMGYEAFSKLAHKLEDLLDLIRNKKLTINKEIMDLLFEGCDLLETGMKKISNDTPEEIEINGIIAQLEKITPSKDIKQKAEQIISDTVIFNETEETLIKTLAIDKKDIKRLIIDFSDHPLKFAKALTIINNIQNDTEIKVIRLNPDKKDITIDKFQKSLEIILHTNNISKIDAIIKPISKVDRYKIFNLNDSYDEHSKEVNKSDIIADHTKELKKVQEVRIDIKKLDNLMNMIGELLIHKMRLEKINETLASKDLEQITNSINLLTQDIQNEVLEERMIPLGSAFSRLPRIVRDLSKEEEKNVEFIMIGDDNKLDRTVIDKIIDPLVHIIRNSVDHGIEKPNERKIKNKSEKGTIKLEAKREKNHILIEIEDDGAGIDPKKIKEVAIKKNILPHDEINSMNDNELINLIFKPGFSTSEKVTEISGRGVGMDVVETNIKQVGGNVILSSVKDEGTKIRIELPLTMAIITVLIVNIEKEKYAVPLNNIVKTLKINKNQIKTINNHETFIMRDEDIPIIRLKKLMGYECKEDNDLITIIVENNYKKVGLIIDSIENQQQILIKNIDEEIKKTKGIAGATILGDGKVCFILDIPTLMEL